MLNLHFDRVVKTEWSVLDLLVIVLVTAHVAHLDVLDRDVLAR